MTIHFGSLLIFERAIKVIHDAGPGSSKVLYQIHSDNTYIYGATTEGLEIYDIITENLQCLKPILNTNITSVHGNTETLYIGTSSGLYTLSLEDVYLNCENSEIIQSNLCLHCEDIRYVYTNTINRLAACTMSGVEYFDTRNNPKIHSKSTVSGVKKCFMANSSLYYTISGTNSSLVRQDALACDWDIPTKVYTTGSGIFTEGIQLTDIYITEGTAELGGNTIFCTTTSGVYVIDEDTQEYIIYYTNNLS